MATSSATSHGWRMSDLVGGTSTRSVPPRVSSIFVGSCMRQSSAAMALVSMSVSVTPIRFRTYSGSTSTNRVIKSGYARSAPEESTTSTGSTENLAAEYSENMVTTVLSTIFALLRSVAVHSMKTSVVSSEMAECAPLMMGGSDSTVLFAS